MTGCVLLRRLEAMQGELCLLEDVGGDGGAEGDGLCITLYAGGRGW